MAIFTRRPSGRALARRPSAPGKMRGGIDLSYQGGVLVGKVLDGTRPQDLPVELQTRFQLVVNLRTAQALGFTIPALLLGRADEIIE